MTDVNAAGDTLDSARLGADIRASSKIVYRGSKFNVHVSIRNPFDTPIRVIRRSWQLPPGLSFIGESPGNEDVGELQPGDSCSLVYVIQAHGVFRRSRQTPAHTGENFIGINVAYEREARIHWQVLRASLNVYASPMEIYLGAIGAAIVGSYVRNPTFGFEHVLSGVLGFFLVLIAKRRSDVQFGISVEDWVGGAIVGFSVGYLGTSYVDRLLQAARTP